MRSGVTDTTVQVELFRYSVAPAEAPSLCLGAKGTPWTNFLHSRSQALLGLARHWISQNVTTRTARQHPAVPRASPTAPTVTGQETAATPARPASCCFTPGAPCVSRSTF